MRYEKSETFELGNAEDLVLVFLVLWGIEENHANLVPLTTNPPAAYLTEFDDE
jgi:hypothetical protein